MSHLTARFNTFLYSYLSLSRSLSLALSLSLSLFVYDVGKREIQTANNNDNEGHIEELKQKTYTQPCQASLVKIHDPKYTPECI